jgi:hypothetical protein
MAFRIGVNNIAARLEKLAEPGGICIARSVYEQVKGKLPYAYIDLGDQRVHNIAEPVRVFKVRLEGGAPPDQPVSRRLHSSVLTVSALDSFASRWLVPRLAAFRRAHKDIGVWLWTSEKLADFTTDRANVAASSNQGLVF